MIDSLFQPVDDPVNGDNRYHEEATSYHKIFRCLLFCSDQISVSNSELFVEFFKTSNARKPKQIIIFRDGVSESQFNQVLNIVVDQIIKVVFQSSLARSGFYQIMFLVKAYQRLGETDVPKFTVIVAQKRHHTKLFQAKGHENVPAGTVVDTKISFTPHCICLCFTLPISQGTSRPAHYHVLLDEIGFSPDELQNLIHSLSYV
ncbi:hypothetical protein IGI04_012924 [Brassica rapa subsp. trilocularis]|uniref:Piwi domain-containing protein n=1 Tax=Brassica rapa subsp. trilocularis TaxID=1813537 RepID=A0ABQ7N7D1_BRACM|nr:hypothetical protein IGI04_038682 [Brassica rapa subsp. trilocularis]KAG5406805.1 hypothetical protein IGI04_012924 [Brassica rapa subsp. trilocularis]